MKYLKLLPFIPMVAHAGFSKPELLARFNLAGAWNVPDNTWCFSGEPVANHNKVYLNCIDVDGSLMASWGSDGYKSIARSENGQLLSKPLNSIQGVSWYEYTEASVVRAFTSEDKVVKTEINNLGPRAEMNDSFFPLTKDSFFFKTKGEDTQLYIWKNDKVTTFFNPKAAYIFYPIIGPEGEIVMKTRDDSYAESAPDRLWVYNKDWKVILEDRDANPESKWKSFRHQLSVEGDKVLAIATDDTGEALILIDQGKVEVIARAGKDLSSFDGFGVKMRAGTIVVRGEDLERKKAVYVKDEGPFRKLLAQGDIVHTDMGPGKVHYQDRHAIFYGAPGLDEKGNVYLQATLTDPDHPQTLMGVGLIKFSKE